MSFVRKARISYTASRDAGVAFHHSTLVIEGLWLTSGFPAQIEGLPPGGPFALGIITHHP